MCHADETKDKNVITLVIVNIFYEIRHAHATQPNNYLQKVSENICAH